MPPAAASSSLHAAVPFRLKLCVLLLCIAGNFCVFADRGVLGASLVSIKTDSGLFPPGQQHMSDASAGLISTVYTAGLIIGCPMFGFFVHYFRQLHGIVIGLLLFIGGDFLVVFVEQYDVLLIGRFFAGIGAAALYVNVPIILDDIVSPEHRTLWFSMYMMSFLVGLSLGAAGTGTVSKDVIMGLSGWKFILLVLLVIESCTVIAILILSRSVHLHSPQYSPKTLATVAPMQSESAPIMSANDEGSAVLAVDGSHPDSDDSDDEIVHKSAKEIITALLHNWVYLYIVVGHIGFMFFVGALSGWNVTYLEVGPLHLDPIVAATELPMVQLACSLVAQGVGGAYLDRTGGTVGEFGVKNALSMLVPTVFAAYAITPAIYLCDSLRDYAILYGIHMLMQSFGFPSLIPMTLSTVKPEQRTWAMSLLFTVMHSFGDLVSPTIVGLLSDDFSEGCSNTNIVTEEMCVKAGTCRWVTGARNSTPYCTNIYQLQKAFLIVSCTLLFGGVFWGLAWRHVTKYGLSKS
eukprot:PhF_6_TR32998/c0_g1_i1/m.48622